MQIMCEHTTYSPIQRYAYDPTRTATLRNVFSRSLRKRFRELGKVIQEAVVRQDVFGLGLQTNAELQSPGYRAFMLPTITQQIKAFIAWLQRQEYRGILESGYFHNVPGYNDQLWIDLFIIDAFKKGILRARSEMRKAGYEAPPINTDNDDAILALLLLPAYINRLHYVLNQASQQLNGIVSDMHTKMSQIIGEGLIDEDNPSSLARKINSVLTGDNATDLGVVASIGLFIAAMRRADMLGRTEVIRAHHQGMMAEYETWGVAGVSVTAEWRTAGDARVCDYCAGMDGQEFSLEEINHMIPAHVGCRCMAIPLESERTDISLATVAGAAVIIEETNEED